MSVFQFMLAKPECRLVMPVGNCTVWSMEFSPMAKCPATRPLEAVTILSTLSSVKLVQENMFPEQYLSTWNQRWSVGCMQNIFLVSFVLNLNATGEHFLCKTAVMYTPYSKMATNRLFFCLRVN